MQSYRWIFYAVNGLGLGHLTRTMALARQVRSRLPHSQFLFLTTSEAAGLFWQEGFACVKLPSRMAAQQSGLRYGTYNQLLHTLVVNTIGAFHPHVLVVDTFPAGSAKELLPVLRWSGKRVFIYREQKQAVCADPWFQQLLPLYDRILIPHCPGEIDLPVPAQIPVQWTGPMLIRDRQEALPRTVARQRLQLLQDKPLLYVGFGGGGDLRYAKLLHWVLAQKSHYPQWQFVVAIPPLSQSAAMDPSVTDNLTEHPTEHLSKYLTEHPTDNNLSTIRYYPLAECWTAFDGAISAAGYNSVSELLHHGIPTIWVPLDRQADHQDQRVDRIVNHRAGWRVNPFDTAALHHCLGKLSDPIHRQTVAYQAQSLAQPNGAAIAAESLVAWLG
ncbi:MAG: glycosyltransferase [Cyanobacteria bacterium P01_F01_bin.150]